MKRVLVIVVAAYFIGYLALRTMNAEVWSEDGQVYVLFPEQPVALYYVYRPLTYLDGLFTGMRFHIGPHRAPPPAIA